MSDVSRQVFSSEIPAFCMHTKVLNVQRNYSENAQKNFCLKMLLAMVVYTGY